MRSFTASEIAEFLQGQVIGDGSVTLTGFAAAENARVGDLTFAENAAYFTRANQSAAAAILVDNASAASDKALIRVANARVAFAKVLPLFFPRPTFAAGIHPSAVIAATAQIDPTAHIGPLCVVGENVMIGAQSVLQSGDHIGAGSTLGAGCHLYPNVTIYPETQIGDRVAIHSGTVIGADGFGYVFDKGQHRKVPQVGNVVIGNDVEIGANVTVDRGALGSTMIGDGTKIDNLVQIAHNVQLGKHCIMVAQGGIAGSTKVGNYVLLGGQVAVIGHIEIGDRASIAARSGVMQNVPAGEKWFGLPAKPSRQSQRELIAIGQLPDMIRRLRKIEKELNLQNPDEPGEAEEKQP